MSQPNILFLMTDQMQGRVLDADHPCITPNFDKLAARGVRITRAYTPNAVCSPARASLMTGRLPHSHGVLTVTHCVDPDQSVLRTGQAHWAQHLQRAGYRTGYFGKWHVHRGRDLTPFGWDVDCHEASDAYRARRQQVHDARGRDWQWPVRCEIGGDRGYRSSMLYGAVDAPPEQRMVGITSALASEFLDDAMKSDQPWCCFVSVIEPHDPFVCGHEAYKKYDVDAIELPDNFADELADKPGLYRKAARTFAHLSDQQKREAMACYWAMVTEIDEQFGRLIDQLEASGQLDNTIIVLSSDHGELLGAHGLYMKNISAFEEVYHIPMLVAGPGAAAGATSEARVGLHDVGPTLLDLAGAEPMDTEGQGRSFASALADPRANDRDFTVGYAEYFGSRFWLTQRVIWDDQWKLVWNWFDEDELYKLDDDPQELRNRIDDPACADVAQRMMKQAWRHVRDTGDASLLNSQYPILRTSLVGPEVLPDE